MITDLEAPPHYTWFEDLQGLLISTLQCAIGLHLLRAAGLVSGGTAGLALLLSYWTDMGFGALFFLVNLPFYGFAYLRRGKSFTLKSFVSVLTVSALTEVLPIWLPLPHIGPWIAALVFGAVTGVGLLGLFRHGASLGGVSILAVCLQDWFGWRAGWVLLSFDLALFAIALLSLAPDLVLWSLMGAVILNFVIAMNHRNDWYVVT